MDSTSRVILKSLMMILFHVTLAESILCYRCDSQIDEGCQFYPTPVSTYEDCDKKPRKIREEYGKPIYYNHCKSGHCSDQSKETEEVYTRYRYKLCPLKEKTIKQVVPKGLDPMEPVNYVCGKAVTHGRNGVRVRRGCTPDLFLSGTDFCATTPKLKNDVVCLCTTDFCNHGRSIYFNNNKVVTLRLHIIFCLFILAKINAQFVG